MRLFATDLDGTLVGRDDGIHPKDSAAIARARERGVVVTIATGRLTSRTHPIARALRLDAPLVCADGSVLACAATERVLRRHPLPLAVVEHAVGLLHEAALASFVFTEAAIHSCQRGVAHHGYVRGWSHAITAHPNGRLGAGWQADDASAVMVLGIGAAERIAQVQSALLGFAPELDALVYESSVGTVLRVMVKGASKGAALLELAAQLGIAREHVAVAGDWYNDVSMFEVAGHSYAMPHAPAELKALASCVLDDDAPRRGAIADALERFCAELG